MTSNPDLEQNILFLLFPLPFFDLQIYNFYTMSVYNLQDLAAPPPLSKGRYPIIKAKQAGLGRATLVISSNFPRRTLPVAFIQRI